MNWTKVEAIGVWTATLVAALAFAVTAYGVFHRLESIERSVGLLEAYVVSTGDDVYIPWIGSTVGLTIESNGTGTLGVVSFRRGPETVTVKVRPGANGGDVVVNGRSGGRYKADIVDFDPVREEVRIKFWQLEGAS